MVTIEGSEVKGLLLERSKLKALLLERLQITTQRIMAEKFKQEDIKQKDNI